MILRDMALRMRLLLLRFASTFETLPPVRMIVCRCESSSDNTPAPMASDSSPIRCALVIRPLVRSSVWSLSSTRLLWSYRWPCIAEVGKDKNVATYATPQTKTKSQHILVSIPDPRTADEVRYGQWADVAWRAGIERGRSQAGGTGAG